MKYLKVFQKECMSDNQACGSVSMFSLGDQMSLTLFSNSEQVNIYPPTDVFGNRHCNF